MDNPQTRHEVGRKLKEARMNKKMTQAEVAKKADLNTNYYACIERGEATTSIERMERIIKALGVKSSKILPF